MGRKLRLPPRHQELNTSEFPYPKIRSHSNLRRRAYPILDNVQRRTRIQPELLRTREEDISELVPSMELDDEQPIMLSGDTNDNEHPEIDSDEVCCP